MKHIVAVYGSLLKGLHNHSVIGRYIPMGKAEFLGEDVVDIPFNMIDLGSFPGIISNDDEEDASNNKIFIEVYKCDDDINTSVERLEGFNSEFPEKGLYRKEIIETSFGKAVVYAFNNDNYGALTEDTVPYYEGAINWRNYIIDQNNNSAW